MIKVEAHDIRIGNILSYIDVDGSRVTGPIKSESVISDIERGASDAYGIPISEVWLLYAGFRQMLADGQMRCRIYEKADVQIKLYKDENTIEALYNREMVTSECKYVHQLQNLYCSLTGTELYEQTEGQH